MIVKMLQVEGTSVGCRYSARVGQSDVEALQVVIHSIKIEACKIMIQKRYAE
jgi:hypothetical protein